MKATVSLELGNLPHDTQQVKALIRACMAHYGCEAPVHLKFVYTPRQKRLLVFFSEDASVLVKYGKHHVEFGVKRLYMEWCIGWAVLKAMRSKSKPPKMDHPKWAAGLPFTVEVPKVEPKPSHDERMAELIDQRQAKREAQVQRYRRSVAQYEKALALAQKKLKAAEKSLEGYAKRGNKYRQSAQSEAALIERLKAKTNSLTPGNMPATVSLETTTTDTVKERDEQ